MKKQGRVVFFYIFAIICILVAVTYSEKMFQGQSQNYNTADLLKDVKKDKVSSVVIKQNKEVPTGEVVVELKSGTRKSYAVSRISTRLVAAITIIPSLTPKPSISTNLWFKVCSLSS